MRRSWNHVFYRLETGHVDFVADKVPEHLDERVGEGVEVDVELAICGRLMVSDVVRLKG